jgi:hypothetical protein
MKNLSFIKSRYLYLGIVLLLFSFNSNKPKFFQTECVSLNVEGYTHFKIWSPKKKIKYKFVEAQKDGVYAVLFDGIAGGNGCQTLLPILNDGSEIEKFKTIEQDFFAKTGDWNKFSSNNLKENIVETDGQKLKVFELAIAKENLRKYLEEKNIIKKLNNGF